MSVVWIRRRKNRKGRPWVVAWNDRGGKRRQQTFETQEEAEQFRAKKVLELGQAAPAPLVDPRITVREYSKVTVRT